MKNGCFSWDQNSTQTLNDINLNIQKGSLVAIVGRIGSGKSSLLSALLGMTLIFNLYKKFCILGEMHRNDGYVSLRGRVAYVPQQAWIQNLSLKSNILFNQEFDEKLYRKVLEACSLAQDLETLPAGDETEIGEKVKYTGFPKKVEFL
jgi:ATP-binding cassette, subfamily C (CFTR/MRP), member 1